MSIKLNVYGNLFNPEDDEKWKSFMSQIYGIHFSGRGTWSIPLAISDFLKSKACYGIEIEGVWVDNGSHPFNFLFVFSSGGIYSALDVKFIGKDFESKDCFCKLIK